MVDSLTLLVIPIIGLVDNFTQLVDSLTQLVNPIIRLVDSFTQLVDSLFRLVNNHLLKWLIEFINKEQKKLTGIKKG